MDHGYIYERCNGFNHCIEMSLPRAKNISLLPSISEFSDLVINFEEHKSSLSKRKNLLWENQAGFNCKPVTERFIQVMNANR